MLAKIFLPFCHSSRNQLLLNGRMEVSVYVDVCMALALDRRTHIFRWQFSLSDRIIIIISPLQHTSA